MKYKNLKLRRWLVCNSFLSCENAYSDRFPCDSPVKVGLDRRPVMRKAYQLFKHGGDPNDVSI